MDGAGALYVVASSPDAGPGPGLYILVGLVAFLLLLPFVLALLLPTLQSRRQRRSGWWLYLVGFFVPFVNLMLLVAWFAWFRKHPTKLPAWTFGSWEVVV